MLSNTTTKKLSKNCWTSVKWAVDGEPQTNKNGEEYCKITKCDFCTKLSGNVCIKDPSKQCVDMTPTICKAAGGTPLDGFCRCGFYMFTNNFQKCENGKLVN